MEYEVEDQPAVNVAAVNKLAGLGPPSDPLRFPRPQSVRGRRDTVFVYNPDNEDDEPEDAENVLFRDYSRSSVGASVTHAYWPDPRKDRIKTNMGHVEICIFLERCTRQQNNEDEDRMVFQQTNRRVAVKVNRCDHPENPEQEIAAMQLLGQDPVHVLRVEEVLNDGQNLNIVMPFCDRNDLFELIQPREGGRRLLTEDQARVWIRQIMKGVSFLHSKGICHRDLSPENVMIDGEEMFIIDMGMCLRVPYMDPMNSGARTDVLRANGMPRCLFNPQGCCGKLPYMSPEIYSNQGPFDGAAVDVWTSGVIFFCMVGGTSYGTPQRLDPVFRAMTQALRPLLAYWNIVLSEDGLDLLEGMLQADPRQRLTLEEVCGHPWFDEQNEAPADIIPEG